ncbi:ABC transporter ATP-binding protein [Phytoactinopolyspora limicola]|uniref:ABC transporter ATP-binding protein n=1 Tax=Phytoactinopolyspora limicola TaxID=2715536 RepID=UPI001A9C3E62|nr:ABC transporter ATP-binding protein [Phytoactinopolyspora limicola]
MTGDGGLHIRSLRVVIGRDAGTTILHGIDLDVPRGQVTGLAGESGSGKTITGMSVMGLLPTTARASGQILFEGTDLLTLSARQLNAYRGARIAMVFQDPTASLHPMLSIGGQLTDHYRSHTGASKREAKDRAVEMLTKVQVPEPEIALHKYPHQFSGGQLQRVAIAGALMCGPSVLIADEPTTALDVTVQAELLRLLRGLCDDLGLAVLLITHDLGVMSSLADRIAVMKDGRIVELGDRYQVITAPQDPYTRSLIDALPAADGASAGGRCADGADAARLPGSEGSV